MPMASAAVLDDGGLNVRHDVEPQAPWVSESHASAGAPDVVATPIETAAEAADRLVAREFSNDFVAAPPVPIRLWTTSQRGRSVLDAIGVPGLASRSSTQPRFAFLSIVAAPLALLIPLDSAPRLRWALAPSDGDVTSRADALRFLRALSGEAKLAIEDLGGGPYGTVEPLRLNDQEWDLEPEWRLFEDLAAIVEWSGARLPPPKSLSALEATQVAQVARWIRVQRIDAQLTAPIRLAARLEDLPQSADGQVVTVEHRFRSRIIDRDFGLGVGRAQVPIEHFEAVDTAASPALHAYPLSAEVQFFLEPPPSRLLPARRTQGGPGAPKYGARPSFFPKSSDVEPARVSLRTALAEIERGKVDLRDPRPATRALEYLRGDDGR